MRTLVDWLIKGELNAPLLFGPLCGPSKRRFSSAWSMAQHWNPRHYPQMRRLEALRNTAARQPAADRRRFAMAVAFYLELPDAPERAAEKVAAATVCEIFDKSRARLSR